MNNGWSHDGSRYIICLHELGANQKDLSRILICDNKLCDMHNSTLCNEIIEYGTRFWMKNYIFLSSFTRWANAEKFGHTRGENWDVRIADAGVLLQSLKKETFRKTAKNIAWTYRPQHAILCLNFEGRRKFIKQQNCWQTKLCNQFWHRYFSAKTISILSNYFCLYQDDMHVIMFVMPIITNDFIYRSHLLTNVRDYRTALFYCRMWITFNRRIVYESFEVPKTRKLICF